MTTPAYPVSAIPEDVMSHVAFAVCQALWEDFELPEWHVQLRDGRLYAGASAFADFARHLENKGFNVDLRRIKQSGTN